jgi:hypothetical protein
MSDLERAGEHERRYQELRLRVQQRRSAVAALDHEAAAPEQRDAATDGEAAGSAATVARLIAATDELLAFEDRLPVLRDLPARALSVQVVRASALAALLGGVLLGLGIWRGALGWGWLPVVLITLVAALRTATLSVAPAAGGHRRQRYAAAVCGAAALLIGPGAAISGWPFGLVCAVVHALALGVLLELPELSRGRA